MCYAVVSYQTAYLKCHYPKQYMAALMTSVLDSATKISTYIAECKELQIPVLPPDINHSEDHFSVEGNAIRFGLGAVKNVGHGLIRSIVNKRASGPFLSLEDFIQRMDEGELNKRAVENFIKCGAMDCFGYHRSQLLAVYDQIMDSVAHTRRKTLDGQMGMFDLFDQDEPAISIPIPNLAEMNKVDLMQLEKETTGIYLTGHPMDDYRKYLKYTHVLPMIQLMGEESTCKDDQIVSVAGIVQNVKMKTTRNNSMMAYVTVEDDTASMEMLAFSNVLQQYGGYIKENAPVVVTGRLSIRDEKEPQIVINRVRSILDFEEAAPQENSVLSADLTLWLKLPSEEDALYRKVRSIVNMFPGDNVVKLFFADTRKIRGTKAALDERMLRELRNVLGEDGVVVK